MNPRRATESGHHQPRVIGEDQPISLPRVMQRLARRIFSERWSGFLERGKRIDTWQQCQLNRKKGG